MVRVILLLLLFIPSGLLAQERPKKFELEAGVNYSFAPKKMGADNIKNGVGGYLEGRFNLKKVPVDVGFQINFTTLRKEYILKEIGSPETGYAVMEMKCPSLAVLAVSNYSFRRGKKIDPYAGLGVGISTNTNPDVSDDFHAYFHFVPRIGVKFLNHIDLSLEYQFSDAILNRACLKLGFYF